MPEELGLDDRISFLFSCWFAKGSWEKVDLRFRSLRMDLLGI
jgi:hypothetical protein